MRTHRILWARFTCTKRSADEVRLISVAGGRKSEGSADERRHNKPGIALGLYTSNKAIIVSYHVFQLICMLHNSAAKASR